MPKLPYFRLIIFFLTFIFPLHGAGREKNTDDKIRVNSFEYTEVGRYTCPIKIKKHIRNQSKPKTAKPIVLERKLIMYNKDSSKIIWQINSKPSSNFN